MLTQYARGKNLKVARNPKWCATLGLAALCCQKQTLMQRRFKFTASGFGIPDLLAKVFAGWCFCRAATAQFIHCYSRRHRLRSTAKFTFDDAPLAVVRYFK